MGWAVGRFRGPASVSPATLPSRLPQRSSVSGSGLTRRIYLPASASDFARPRDTMSQLASTARLNNPFSHASRLPLHSKPSQAIDPKFETRQSAPPTDPAALSALEASKQLAAYAAVDDNILPHHRVIGIGFVRSPFPSLYLC